MRDSIKKAIGETVQDMLNSGIKTSFTKKELDLLGITIPEIKLTTYRFPNGGSKDDRYNTNIF